MTILRKGGALRAFAVLALSRRPPALTAEGKSVNTAQLCIHSRVNITIERKLYRRMTEKVAHGFDICTALNTARGKCMSQNVKISGRYTDRCKHPFVIIFIASRLYIPFASGKKE